MPGGSTPEHPHTPSISLRQGCGPWGGRVCWCCPARGFTIGDTHHGGASDEEEAEVDARSLPWHEHEEGGEWRRAEGGEGVGEDQDVGVETEHVGLQLRQTRDGQPLGGPEASQPHLRRGALELRACCESRLPVWERAG